MKESESHLDKDRIAILHVSADFPDAFDDRKTPAVRNLIELVKGRFDHRVISLNRTSPGLADALGMAMHRQSAILDRRLDDGLESLRYAGFPKGILHASLLQRLADSLCERVAHEPLPDLLVGYKLTVEGLVVAEMAHRLSVPYALVIQGNTDVRILAARPDLRRAFAAALRDAAVVFSLAPWAIERVEVMLKVKARHVVHLPCPIALDTPVTPRVTGGRLVTAFHFRHHRLKNFVKLVQAVKSARQCDADLELAVIGGGEAGETAEVRRIARRSSGITLAGAMPNAAMPACYTSAAGFVLPSLRESFGMVFLEALFCGAPVVYPANRAIGGWFDDEPFAIAVDPRDSEAIKDGMLRLKRDEAHLKSALARWQASGAAAKFTREEISRTFERGLRVAAADRNAPAYWIAA